MPETVQEAVQSILKEIANIEKMMAGKTRFNLEEDITLERAVSMTLGLIGEKANKIPSEFKIEHPEIEWRKIIALRNRIVHSYEDLDFDIIYDTISRKLPELKEMLENVTVSEQKKVLKTKSQSLLLTKKTIKKGKGKKL